MKRAFIAFFLFVFLFSACAPGVPSALPAPTTHPATTVIPTQVLLPTPTLALSPVPDVLYVNPSISLGSISPLIYGSNYGPWLAVSVDMLDAAYDSGVTILRFPAGSWGDQNDVKTYQIDQFMAFAQKVGATAMFNVRLLGGTPEQAAEMVRYTNIEKKYDVHYWGIGNEPTLYNGVVKARGETYDTVRFNREWRIFAEAMKKVDPTIKLVGAEINQFSYDYSPGATTNFSERDETWFIDFLKANGDLVDVVSFHRYPFPRSNTSGPASIDELRQNAKEWDKIIIHARELIHQHTGRDIPIAITEFNSDYSQSVGGEATPDSHFNAIWLADVLGRLIKNNVYMANHWLLASKGGLGGWGLVGMWDMHPSYFVYQLYKKFGSELVYSSSDDSDLSIYAARHQDSTLTLMIVNLAPEEKTKAIRIEGQDQIRAETWLFDPGHKAENVGEIDITGHIAVPGQSVTLYIIRQ